MRLITGENARREWMQSVESRRVTEGDHARRVAAAIIEEVRNDGDAAVARHLQRFDGVEIEPSQILMQPAEGEVPEASLAAAIRVAIERVERFHAGQVVSGYAYEEDGSRFTHHVRPLRRVGIYVPGGGAVYLSTLIMCAVPARLAGVKELIVATTPRAAARGELQYACKLLGIKEIYQAGGASGVAALALGTQSVRRVDKIVGPGNGYVTAAKQLLVGTVGIDMTAGPTEVVILADENASAREVAADLLAQAEHGSDSTPICITTSAEIAASVMEEIERRSGELGDAAPVSLSNGAVIVVGSVEEAIDLTNEIGPEHVELHLSDADAIAPRIENCGAVFIGRLSPVAIGDYVAGPNHVLPTAGAARFFSPLGVYDFYKRSNFARVSETTFAKIADAGRTLASFEGLPLHAESIRIRQDGEV